MARAGTVGGIAPISAPSTPVSVNVCSIVSVSTKPGSRLITAMLCGAPSRAITFAMRSSAAFDAP